MSKANEQWKLNGDCDVCRREKYCSHECKAHKKRIEAEIFNFVAQRTASNMVRSFAREWNNEHD